MSLGFFNNKTSGELKAALFDDIEKLEGFIALNFANFSTVNPNIFIIGIQLIYSFIELNSSEKVSVYFLVRLGYFFIIIVGRSTPTTTGRSIVNAINTLI